MKEQFIFPSIQVRSRLDVNKKPRVIVKGYALAPNIPHEYRKETDAQTGQVKSFRSLFTDNFVESFKNQMAFAPIFVDALHQTAANINIRTTLETMKSRALKTGENFNDEVEAIMANLKMSQFPLGKPVNFNIDDNGMFVEVELNPEFRDVDAQHQKYYDAVVGSLKNGNLNTMSINFAETDVTIDPDGLERINDGKFYGISFMPNGALGASSSITEVAIRSIMEVRTNMNQNGNPTGNEPAQPTPPVQPVQPAPNSDLKRLEAEHAALQAEMNAMKAEKEQAVAAEAYKVQMEAMKKEILESIQATPGPKGTVPGNKETPSASTIKSKEEWIKEVENLTWKEKIQLQNELGGVPYGVDEEIAGRFGALKKGADMDFNKR